MPCHNIFSISISLCQVSCQCYRILAICRTVGAGIVSASKLTFHPVMLCSENIRITSCHPCRMYRSRSSQTHLQMIVFYHIHDLIQFGKIIRSLIRLQHCPAEDIQRNNINVCQLKQAHILFPDFFRPLLQVIIASITDFLNLLHLSVLLYFYNNFLQLPVPPGS